MNFLKGVVCGILLSGVLPAIGQSLQPVEDFLGYPIGSRFTFHHKVVDYLEYLAATSPKVQLIPYGETPEGRELVTAVISSQENLKGLEQIRTNNLKLAGIIPGTPAGKVAPIVWLSYNVHGDEPACTEAALSVLDQLSQEKGPAAKWLEEVVVILDPCLNPDGRERYVNWYTQWGTATPHAQIYAQEHQEPWPSGRTNHYLFDLNRDWCWQIQPESKQRGALYRQWMPQVHADFHEMSIESHYFFAPAAEPYHPAITPWQCRFQELAGAQHAAYFDENNWLYFSGEEYDLFYPSYGDTWPMFNGSIGFTYEQGGKRAGRAAIRQNGDSLLLIDRIRHHVTTSLSTIEVAYKYRDSLLTSFETYFQTAATQPEGEYKTFIIRNSASPTRLQPLLDLLDAQGIQYNPIGKSLRPFQAYDYRNDRTRLVRFQEDDILVSAYQPQGRMVRVLFEPEPELSDSLTYDLTAWALPYMYDLEAYALKEKVTASGTFSRTRGELSSRPLLGAYAYILPWSEVRHVKLLAQLLKNGVKIRMAHQPLVVDGKTHKRGSLVFLRGENSREAEQMLIEFANNLQITPEAVKSGRGANGMSLGSDQIRSIKAPSVALAIGEGISPTHAGAVWHYLEQELGYPVTLLPRDLISPHVLRKHQVVILSSGEYQQERQTLLNYVEAGGRLIVLENAINTFSAYQAKGSNTQLAELVQSKQSRQDPNESFSSTALRYEGKDRQALSDRVAGSIFRVQLDNSHPMSFGMGDHTYWLKRNSVSYPLLTQRAWNVGTFGSDPLVSGFVGHNLKVSLPNSLALGVEYYQQGEIIYLTDSPIFRGFWHAGKLLMGNLLFVRE
ncbi:MAG: M14 family zinc carboxypeptidase [Bacteroidota bacterium]